MLLQLSTIGLLVLLAAMLPGPDFAIVTKNTLLHDRRAGIVTSFGVASACLVHVAYCMLGLALLIAQSHFLFNVIKGLGAAYLVYLGIMTFRTPIQPQPLTNANHAARQHLSISQFAAFRQGFLTNLLNPKATVFFLALFTVAFKPDTFGSWGWIIPIELFLIISTWFCSLTMMLSHPIVLKKLQHYEYYIAKLLGISLILFGVGLAFINPY